MTIKVVSPQRLGGQISLPASKSISNRALIINALSSVPAPLRNISDCDDTFVMRRALSSNSETIDIMAAGTAMRFLSAYLSVTAGTRTITGTERMCHRPIGVLVDALRRLGADILYAGEEGFPPLRITGGVHRGGNLELPGNISSQYISALLMIGPTLAEGLQLHLTGNIISRPYIDLTLQLMKDFGAQAGWTAKDCIKVKPHPYSSIPYYIENDWSAASYWYEILALCGDNGATIRLPGLFRNSPQGDSAVQHLFERIGVHTEFIRTADGIEGIQLHKVPCTTERLDHDFIQQPDLAQTFVVTCCMLGIPFRFTGLQSLRIKETDRMAALICELYKLGFVVTDKDDCILQWNGERSTALSVPTIDTYEDHRMAMAFAPASLVLPELRINHPEVVSKSYPRYWNDLQTAGFKIEEV